MLHPALRKPAYAVSKKEEYHQPLKKEYHQGTRPPKIFMHASVSRMQIKNNTMKKEEPRDATSTTVLAADTL
jgi:hypothetical protein